MCFYESSRSLSRHLATFWSSKNSATNLSMQKVYQYCSGCIITGQCALSFHLPKNYWDKNGFRGRNKIWYDALSLGNIHEVLGSKCLESLSNPPNSDIAVLAGYIMRTRWFVLLLLPLFCFGTKLVDGLIIEAIV